jgi:hypothetical protein
LSTFDFFGFRNLAETLCVSWALSLIECVTVWVLKLPAPHTDVLKTHESQSVSAELLEPKEIKTHTFSATPPVFQSLILLPSYSG